MSFLNPASGEVVSAGYDGRGLPPFVAVGLEVRGVSWDGEGVYVLDAANDIVAQLDGGPSPDDLVAYETATGGVFWVVMGKTGQLFRRELYFVVNFTAPGERFPSFSTRVDHERLFDARVLGGVALGVLYEDQDFDNAYVRETRFSADGDTVSVGRGRDDELVVGRAGEPRPAHHTRDVEIPANQLGLEDYVRVMDAGYGPSDEVLLLKFTEDMYTEVVTRRITGGALLEETPRGVTVTYAGVGRTVRGNKLTTAPLSSLFRTETHVANRLGWMLRFTNAAYLAGGGVYFS